MEYRRSEIRAGIFLLLSFAVLTVMVFAVSDIQSLFRKTKEVKALFLVSDGIEKNAQVRLSGIKVGKVSGIRIAPEYSEKVELTLSIFSDTVIKKDTKAAIKSLGIVGGKYVELSGGSPLSAELDSKGIIIGDESMKLEDLTKSAMEVVGRLKSIAANLDSILGDPALSKSLKATIRNLQEVSSNIKVMTSSKEEVAQGLKNLPDILKKIDDSAANLKAITEKTSDLVGKTGELVKENRKNIDEMVVHFRDMGKNLKDASEDVKKEPWKLLRKP
jgi:phospholipid/cholesterol/gamma-HCH transport system substrate-binding protein